MGKGVTAAASYQDTDEARALGLPETRFLAGLSIDVAGKSETPIAAPFMASRHWDNHLVAVVPR